MTSSIPEVSIFPPPNKRSHIIDVDDILPIIIGGINDFQFQVFHKCSVWI